jgi:hypothetical protein
MRTERPASPERVTSTLDMLNSTAFTSETDLGASHRKGSWRVWSHDPFTLLQRVVKGFVLCWHDRHRILSGGAMMMAIIANPSNDDDDAHCHLHRHRTGWGGVDGGRR